MQRTVIFLLIFLLGLYGCGRLTKVTLEDPYERDLDSRRQEMSSWSRAEKAKVEAGILKNSEYYRLLHNKVLELRPDLTHYLLFTSEMVKVSRLYEEGRITRKQLEQKDIELTILVAQEDNRRDAILSQKPSEYAYETAQFTLYRDSLLKEYMSTLQTRLKESGPQYSVTNCSFFEDRIICTAR
jgi:hypothetical protein